LDCPDRFVAHRLRPWGRIARDTGADDTANSSSTGDVPVETETETGTGGTPDPDDTTGIHCGQDSGCGDNVLVELSAAAFPEGEYEIVLRSGADDSIVDSCAFAIPLADASCIYASSDGSYSAALLPGGIDFDAENRLTVAYKGGVAPRVCASATRLQARRFHLIQAEVRPSPSRPRPHLARRLETQASYSQRASAQRPCFSHDAAPASPSLFSCNTCSRWSTVMA
jgi:hypothetical protein